MSNARAVAEESLGSFYITKYFFKFWISNKINKHYLLPEEL